MKKIWIWLRTYLIPGLRCPVCGKELYCKGYETEYCKNCGWEDLDEMLRY